jgi:hypothetical protein
VAESVLFHVVYSLNICKKLSDFRPLRNHLGDEKWKYLRLPTKNPFGFSSHAVCKKYAKCVFQHFIGIAATSFFAFGIHSWHKSNQYILLGVRWELTLLNTVILRPEINRGKGEVV